MIVAPRIETTRTAPRQVRGANSGREYIIELTSAGVLIREKGRRTTLGPVSYDALFSLAAKLEAGVGALVRRAR